MSTTLIMRLGGTWNRLTPPQPLPLKNPPCPHVELAAVFLEHRHPNVEPVSGLVDGQVVHLLEDLLADLAPLRAVCGPQRHVVPTPDLLRILRHQARAVPIVTASIPICATTFTSTSSLRGPAAAGACAGRGAARRTAGCGPALAAAGRSTPAGGARRGLAPRVPRQVVATTLIVEVSAGACTRHQAAKGP